MTDHLITLGAIRDAGPCGRDDPKRGFGLLLTSLGEPMLGYDRDREVSLGDVAKSNGSEDAWWVAARCLTARVWMPTLLKAVRRAAKHTDDQRVHDCIDTLDRWARGEDVDDDALQAAAEAAWAAAKAAAFRAWAASWAASWAAEAARAEAAKAAWAASWASEAAERAKQVADLAEDFPLYALKGERDD